MTREQMIKRSFKPYMELELETHLGILPVILVATDFDNEVLTVRPVDAERYEQDDLKVSISRISFKKADKLKLVK